MLIYPNKTWRTLIYSKCKLFTRWTITVDDFMSVIMNYASASVGVHSRLALDNIRRRVLSTSVCFRNSVTSGTSGRRMFEKMVACVFAILSYFISFPVSSIISAGWKELKQIALLISLKDTLMTKTFVKIFCWRSYGGRWMDVMQRNSIVKVLIIRWPRRDIASS